MCRYIDGKKWIPSLPVIRKVQFFVSFKPHGFKKHLFSSAASILEIECWWWRGFKLINQIKIWWRKRKFEWKSRRRKGGEKTRGPLEVWWTEAVYMQLIHIGRAALISPLSPSSINQADVNPRLPAPLLPSAPPRALTSSLRGAEQKKEGEKREKLMRARERSRVKRNKSLLCIFPTLWRTMQPLLHYLLSLRLLCLPFKAYTLYSHSSPPSFCFFLLHPLWCPSIAKQGAVNVRHKVNTYLTLRPNRLLFFLICFLCQTVLL